MAFTRKARFELDHLPDEDLIGYVVRARKAAEEEAIADALAVLGWRRYGDLVRRAKLKLPAQDAEDVAAQAFAQAVMAKFKGASVGEFVVLMNTILARRIVDYLKKRKRTPETAPLPEEHLDDEDVHGRDAAVAPDDKGAVHVQDAIDRLLAQLKDPRHLRAVELYVFEGHSGEAAAELINREFPEGNPPMTENNVQQIASRFRKEMRAMLEDGE